MKSCSATRFVVLVAALLCAATTLVGCAGEDAASGSGDGPGTVGAEGEGETDPGFVCEDPTMDTDGDGLSDCDERSIHRTSPLLEDTDGDGLSDMREVLDFDPGANNYRFNPLVADVPKIRFEMTSLPTLGLNYTTTEGAEHTVSTERTVESANSVTTSEATTNSTAVEQTHEAGASLSVGYSWGITGGASVEGTVSYSYSHSTTNETSVTFSEEQTQENREALAMGEQFAESNAIESSGGALGVTLTIHNEGNLAFTVDSMILSAVSLDPTVVPTVQPIANLSLETEQANFPSFSLGPGTSAQNLYFVNNELSLEVIQNLMRNSHGISVGVAAYEVTDENGRSYSHDLTTIGTRDASVIIDYAGARPSERYLVATTGNPDTRSLTAAEALGDVLAVPYDNKGGELTSVRDIAKSELSQWVVLHVQNNGVEVTSAQFDENGGLDLNALELRAGDVLHLVYLEDTDGDGLGTRQEFFYGTDPNVQDTDGDGVSDYDEVHGWTVTVLGESGDEVSVDVTSDGRLKDTDNDGLTDDRELEKGTHPFSPDTDGDRLGDRHDFAPTIFNRVDVSGMSATVNLEEPFSNSEAAISWTNPIVPQFVGFEVAIARQVIGADGSFSPLAEVPTPETDLSVGNLLGCVDGSACFEVVYVGAGESFIDNNLVDQSRVRYLPLVRIADVWIESRQVLDEQIALPTQNLVLDFNGLYQISCLDSVSTYLGYLWLPSDVTCEIYWQLRVDGVLVAERTKSDRVRLETADSLDINSTYVLPTPAVEGVCRDLEFRILEAENSNNFSEQGDIRNTINHQVCYEGGQWVGLGEHSRRTSKYDVGALNGGLANDSQIRELASRVRIYFDLSVE